MGWARVRCVGCYSHVSLSGPLSSLPSLPQFLAFDTQLLMGSRRHSLSPEEYIFGALNIYLDIIYIFTFFLQLFGTNRE